MQKICISKKLCIGLLLLLMLIVIPTQLNLQATTQQPIKAPRRSSPSNNNFSPKGVGRLSNRQANQAGNLLPIATSSDREEDAAVALCFSDEYLVVYTRQNNIWGQRLTSDGSLIDVPFRISDDTQNSRLPDVACDWVHDRFIVVWEYDDGGNTNILARSVHGAFQLGSQLIGPEISVVSLANSEITPSIACNSNQNTCLAVYGYDWYGDGSEYDIYGQRIAVGLNGISKEQGLIYISTETGIELFPNVTWAADRQEYLVAWQQYHIDHWRIKTCVLHDTHQLLDQLKSACTWLIDPTDYARSQTVPSVAYNHKSGYYLVAFQYDWNGDGSDYDIFGRYIHSSIPVGDVLRITRQHEHELSPKVAFSGGTKNLPSTVGRDEFLVTFKRQSSSAELLAQTLAGSWPDYVVTYNPLELRALDNWDNLFNADLVGSAYTGNYLAVWQDEVFSGGSSWDILGLLISADQNEAPTDIQLSNSNVAENQPINTIVGTLTTSDPDAGDTFTYTLIPGVGDTDNASFNILGSNLRTSESFDFNNKNSYNIRVRSTDQGGLFYEKTFVINIIRATKYGIFIPLIEK